jgi:hypothetical protein
VRVGEVEGVGSDVGESLGLPLGGESVGDGGSEGDADGVGVADGDTWAPAGSDTTTLTVSRTASAQRSETDRCSRIRRLTPRRLSSVGERRANAG